MQTDQADFTGWMYVLLKRQTKPFQIQKPSGKMPKAFNQDDITGKTLKYLCMNILIYQND